VATRANGGQGEVKAEKKASSRANVDCLVVKDCDEARCWVKHARKAWNVRLRCDGASGGAAVQPQITGRQRLAKIWCTSTTLVDSGQRTVTCCIHRYRHNQPKSYHCGNLLSCSHSGYRIPTQVGVYLLLLSVLSRLYAAEISARCEKACGVFPSCSPDAEISSEKMRR